MASSMSAACASGSSSAAATSTSSRSSRPWPPGICSTDSRFLEQSDQGHRVEPATSNPRAFKRENAMFEVQPIEDEQEKALRLHKERYSFWIKDIGTYAFGIAFLIAFACYCFWA